jgi:predicted O-methyltransferase YrrM
VPTPSSSRDALREHGSELALVLAEALDRHADGRFGDAERALSGRIETVRAELVGRSDQIDPPKYTDLTVGEATKGASVKQDKGLALCLMVRAVRPTVCLELGTNVGISAAYQAGALALDGAGRLLSLEGSQGRAAVARSTFERLGLGNVELRIGRFHETFAPALEELGRIDYAFVDGNHKEEPTLAYFDAIVGRIRRPGYVVFDDIRWSEGMMRAWEGICADGRVSMAVSLGAVGLCLFD